MIAQLFQNASEEQLLGEIETRIVGLQYHDAAFEPGEAIYLEREPDNVHDGQAVRVENHDFEQIGYLPKKLASWLAPLIDAGKLRVDGYVPENIARLGKNTAPAVLVVFLCEKGHRLLEKGEVRTKQDALHEVVRHAYRDVQHYSDADLVLELVESLQPLTCQEMLPETRLLLALMPGITCDIRATKSFQTMVDFLELLAKVTVGQPLHHHGLTIFPLSWPESQESPYVLLEEAIERGDAEVTEVDEDGHVPNLSVTNHGSRPILIPEGAILVGAKQNRVVNVTVLVAADSQFTLPVSCVEQGRWEYSSRTFQSEFCAPPSLCKSKLRAVHANRAADGASESDQGEVWDRVEDCLSSMEVESDTASLTDGMEAAEEKLQQYRQAFQLPSCSADVVVARGDQVVGMDLFDSSQTFDSLWSRLGDAYFFDALRRPNRSGKANRELAQRFVENTAARARPQPSALGLGDELEINQDGIIGAGLIYSERVCHVAAFANSLSPGKT